MNFVAHAHAHLRSAPGEWEPAFGAVLPDLASMLGFRLDRATLTPAIAKGVAAHHVADAAFHATLEFRQGAAPATRELIDRGLRRGAARAVGHAGYELLLDGCLLDGPDVAEEFDRVLGAGAGFLTVVKESDRPAWEGLLRSLTVDRWWLGYRDPGLVARALYRRLRLKRLLAFSEPQLPVVTAVLAELRPVVATGTGPVMEAVREAVTETVPASPYD